MPLKRTEAKSTAFKEATILNKAISANVAQIGSVQRESTAGGLIAQEGVVEHRRNETRKIFCQQNRKKVKEKRKTRKCQKKKRNKKQAKEKKNKEKQRKPKKKKEKKDKQKSRKSKGKKESKALENERENSGR